MTFFHFPSSEGLEYFSDISVRAWHSSLHRYLAKYVFEAQLIFSSPAHIQNSLFKRLEVSFEGHKNTLPGI